MPVEAASTAISIMCINIWISLDSVDFCSALDAAGMMIRAATFFDKAVQTLSAVSVTCTVNELSSVVFRNEAHRRVELVSRSDK